MIRLCRARCDKRIRPLLQRLPDKKLELPRFVAAKRKASLIVALDQQLRPAEFSRKRFQFLNRRWQLSQRKTRQRFDSHQTFLSTGSTRGQSLSPNRASFFARQKKDSLLRGRNYSFLCLMVNGPVIDEKAVRTKNMRRNNS